MPKSPSPVRLPIAVLAALVLAAAPARAAIIDVVIATTVDSYVAAQSLPIAFGDAVVMSFSYDDEVPDFNLTPGVGQFTDPLTALSVAFPDSGLVFTWAGGDSIMATTDDTPTVLPGVTVFSDTLVLGTVTGPISGLLGGDVVNSISFGFAQSVFGGTPTQVVNDLPNPPFTFDGLGVSTIVMQGFDVSSAPYADAFNLAGGTGSVVPEPAAATLIGFALLGAVGLRRR